MNSTDSDTRTQFLRWRGIDTHERVCAMCDGSGIRGYSNTSTWRGGVGGQMFTNDVCNGCWGTGTCDRTGVDLRAQQHSEGHRIAKAAMELLCRRAMVDYPSVRDAARAVADELDKLANGRKPRPQSFHECCRAIANTLRMGVADREEYDRIAKEYGRR